MPEFSLNTGGVAAHARYATLDSFVQGYIEAAVFCGVDVGREDGEGDSSVSFDAFAPETIECIKSECGAFLDLANPDLEMLYALSDYDAVQAGRDFWFTRCRHGVGYWDREELAGVPTVQKRLTDLAHVAGERSLIMGDDGQVHHC